MKKLHELIGIGRSDRIAVQGCLDGLSGHVALGWAFAEGQPQTRLAVEILDDGVPVARGLADVFRPDLKGTGIGDGNHGFAIPLPETLADGKLHRLTARVAEEESPLDGEQMLKVPVQGCLDGLNGLVALGWVFAEGQPQTRLAVEILDDGVPVARGLADVFRPDLKAAGIGDGNHGFAIPLPDTMADGKPHRLTARVAESLLDGEQMLQAPWGRFERIEGIHCVGWAMGADGRAAHVELLVDGKPAASVPAFLARPELSALSLPTVKIGFRLPLPDSALTGGTHSVSLRVVGTAEYLPGSGRNFAYAPLFNIDHVDLFRVAGWIFNRDSDDASLQLDVHIGDQLVGRGGTEFREDVFRAHGRRYTAFNIPLRMSRADQLKANNFRFFLSGTRIPALPVDVSLAPAEQLIRAMEGLGASMNEDAAAEADDRYLGSLTPGMRTMLRKTVFPRLIQEMRNGLLKGESVRFAAHYRKTPAQTDIVDVIIPVFRGFEETLACVKSVLAGRGEVAYELVVINDASPDLRLTSALQALAEEQHFTLLENSHNLGFVGTVNRGMMLHEGERRDVVLLNSDTVVPSGWLDGLRRAAYVAPAIGTVTPFSNRATICSLPIPQFDNDMVEGCDCQAMHDLCASVNGDEVVDIPTAVGFCMYIRRSTLSEVGLFDVERWKQGYAEENDFCVRARALGWRNVAAAGVFVQHHGAVSFGDEKDGKIKENLGLLNRLYPDYNTTIQKFISDDPLGPARGRINIALLKQRISSSILHISHRRGGGTDRAIRDIGGCLATEGVASIVMRPAAHGRVEVSSLDGAIPVSVSLRDGLAPLTELLRELGVVHVHFHQVIGYPARIWDVPLLLGVPYDVSVHDYLAVCPRITLINASGYFCGQPDVHVCEACVSAKPLDSDIAETFAEVGGSAAAWQSFFAERLAGARRVIAPSEDASHRIRRYQAFANVFTKPHPESGLIGKARSFKEGETVVAVIGALGPHKGSALLLQCAQYAKEKALPLQFVVIGYTDRDDLLKGMGNVIITGKYEAVDLSRLVDAFDCSIALFLNLWPETYSYTLSEALEEGMFPVAFDLGAFERRIAASGRGLLIPFVPTAETVVQALLSINAKTIATDDDGTPVGSTYLSCLKDYYGLGPEDQDQ